MFAEIREETDSIQIIFYTLTRRMMVLLEDFDSEIFTSSRCSLGPVNWDGEFLKPMFFLFHLTG